MVYNPVPVKFEADEKFFEAAYLSAIETARWILSDGEIKAVFGEAIDRNQLRRLLFETDLLDEINAVLSDEFDRSGPAATFRLRKQERQTIDFDVRCRALKMAIDEADAGKLAPERIEGLSADISEFPALCDGPESRSTLARARLSQIPEIRAAAGEEYSIASCLDEPSPTGPEKQIVAHLRSLMVARAFELFVRDGSEARWTTEPETGDVYDLIAELVLAGHARFEMFVDTINDPLQGEPLVEIDVSEAADDDDDDDDLFSDATYELRMARAGQWRKAVALYGTEIPSEFHTTTRGKPDWKIPPAWLFRSAVATDRLDADFVGHGRYCGAYDAPVILRSDGTLFFQAPINPWYLLEMLARERKPVLRICANEGADLIKDSDGGTALVCTIRSFRLDDSEAARSALREGMEIVKARARGRSIIISEHFRHVLERGRLFRLEGPDRRIARRNRP